MMFSSSPPCGPCSTVHSSPVSGWIAAPSGSRRPCAKVCASTVARDSQGLSVGIEPSRFTRSTRPAKLRRTSGSAGEILLHAIQVRRRSARSGRQPVTSSVLSLRQRQASLGAGREMVRTFSSLPTVGAELGARHALDADLHRAAHGQWRHEHAVVEIFERPGAAGFARFGREVGEVQRAITTRSPDRAARRAAPARRPASPRAGRVSGGSSTPSGRRMRITPACSA